MKYKLKVIVDVMSTYIDVEIEADNLADAKEEARRITENEVGETLKRTVYNQGYEVLVEHADD